jgi:AraC family transcriptional regulator
MSVAPSDDTSAQYGGGLARKFGLEEAPAIVVRVLQRAEFAATELRVDRPSGELSEPVSPADAYAICVLLQDPPAKNYWEEGREVGWFFPRLGESVFSDMRRDPRILMNAPSHTLLMYLPRTTMNLLAEDASLPRVDDLSFEPGAGIQDDTLRGLAHSLLPALRAPETANRLFVDHIALALASHAAHAYGGQTILRPVRGGLAPWQERRAKEIILGNLSGTLSTADIASACNLSASYFARAFRKTTGVAPHAWLMRARVERALILLRQRDATMASIARDSGFADQSHFARVFTRQMGVGPSAWRRLSVR